MKWRCSSREWGGSLDRSLVRWRVEPGSRESFTRFLFFAICKRDSGTLAGEPNRGLPFRRYIKLRGTFVAKQRKMTSRRFPLMTKVSHNVWLVLVGSSPGNTSRRRDKMGIYSRSFHANALKLMRRRWCKFVWISCGGRPSADGIRRPHIGLPSLNKEQ